LSDTFSLFFEVDRTLSSLCAASGFHFQAFCDLAEH
jgi:hypothetical protein